MMPPRPDLSIVIVNWNTREMLGDCLTRVRAGLRGITAEVIVVDNHSSDGSAGMVADAFPEVTLIRNAENRGFAAANNQGFELARGRHILLLNSDTVVTPGESLLRLTCFGGGGEVLGQGSVVNFYGGRQEVTLESGRSSLKFSRIELEAEPFLP